MVASSNVNVRSLTTRILVITFGAIILWILYSSYNTHFHSGLAKGQKVNVTVFYEVLCPDSRHFILRQLQPTWEKVAEIMDINYRPFGKAHVSNFSHFKQPNYGGEGRYVKIIDLPREPSDHFP